MSSIRAFTKSTGATPAKSNKTLNHSSLASADYTVTQPAVVYDPIGKRFIAVAITNDER